MSSEDIAQAEERSSHRSIVIDKVLYTWGGDQPGLPKIHDNSIKRKLTSRISTFHIPTGIWKMTSTTGSPPLGVRGYSCSVIDEQNISFFGGWCGHDDCYHNSLYSLNTRGFNWRVLSHTTDDIPVMRRGHSGMITVEDHDGIKLLMIGGEGSPPTIPNQQFQYIKLPDGEVRTNEVNLFTPSTGKWSTPTMIGDVMPPNSSFTIEKLSKSKAIIFGGMINEGYLTNNIYIVEIINSTVHWQNIKSSQSIGQWPEERYDHASSIINSSVLAALGGVDQTDQVVNEKCLWLYSIDQRSWTKIDVPNTVRGRYDHSLSSLMIGPHCVWLVVLGGWVNPEKRNVDGVDELFADLVSSPNISMIIELMFSDGDWSLGFVLDDKSIHLLELIYKDRVKHNLSNDEMSPEDDSLKELRHSLYKDLETSQQTIKSLQEALLDTKEEWNKQAKEKDSLIAKMTRKVPEHTLVNELGEKDKVISKLTSELVSLKQKKQDEESKPTDKSIDDDITFESEQNKAIIANLSNELKSLKESNKLIDDDKSCTQLVHDNDCQFTLDDVSKLMVILQPVEDDWYQLGRHLNMEESTLRDAKQTDIPLEYLLQRWCSEGGTLMKLEKALISINRTDVLSGLHDLKQTPNDDTSSSTDTSVQCDYWNINDSFEGLLTVGKKNVFYRADIEHEMTLEECGLKLSIPELVVTPPESVYEVAAEGVWGGDFIFPEGTNLISGVCYISISSSSHLNKPVTVQLEHCANIIHQDQVKYLSFVTANSDRPPYQFQLISGGIFNIHTRHGTISLKKFSLVAIVCISSAFLIQPVSDLILPFAGTVASVSTSLVLNGGVYGIAISGVIGLVLYKWLVSPIPEPSVSIPEPAVPIPEPIPEPSVSIPEPAVPIPEPIPEPSVSIPEPAVPIPEPIPEPAGSISEDNLESIKNSPPNNLYQALVMYKSDYKKFIMNFVVFQANKYSEYIQQSSSWKLGEVEHKFCFEFSKSNKLALSNFPGDGTNRLNDVEDNGWEIIPLSQPVIIKKKEIIDFTESKNSSVPYITVVIQPQGSNCKKILKHVLNVEGTDQPHRTITIYKSYDDLIKPKLIKSSSPSSSGPTPSTNEEVDIKQLIRVINEVLVSCHANLSCLPEESLQELADQLYASNLISNSVKKNPTMDKCISEFNASLNWLRSQSAIESQCSKFLKAFMAVKGSYSTAANALREDLIVAVNNELNCNFNIELC